MATKVKNKVKKVYFTGTGEIIGQAGKNHKVKIASVNKYKFKLMPSENFTPQEGTIYIDINGNYIVRDFNTNKNLHGGIDLQEIIRFYNREVEKKNKITFPLTDNDLQKLLKSNTAFKEKILWATTQRGHTKSEKQTKYIPSDQAGGILFGGLNAWGAFRVTLKAVNDLYKSFKEWYEKNKNNKDAIYTLDLSGHSRGGATAFLVAKYLGRRIKRRLGKGAIDSLHVNILSTDPVSGNISPFGMSKYGVRFGNRISNLSQCTWIKNIDVHIGNKNLNEDQQLAYDTIRSKIIGKLAFNTIIPKIDPAHTKMNIGVECQSHWPHETRSPYSPYTVVSMSKLENKNPQTSGNIYLSPEGKYVFLDSSGKVQEGEFGIEALKQIVLPKSASDYVKINEFVNVFRKKIHSREIGIPLYDHNYMPVSLNLELVTSLPNTELVTSLPNTESVTSLPPKSDTPEHNKVYVTMQGEFLIYDKERGFLKGKVEESSLKDALNSYVKNNYLTNENLTDALLKKITNDDHIQINSKLYIPPSEIKYLRTGLTGGQFGIIIDITNTPIINKIEKTILFQNAIDHRIFKQLLDRKNAGENIRQEEIRLLVEKFHPGDVVGYSNHFEKLLAVKNVETYRPKFAMGSRRLYHEPTHSVVNSIDINEKNYSESVYQRMMSYLDLAEFRLKGEEEKNQIQVLKANLKLIYNQRKISDTADVVVSNLIDVIKNTIEHDDCKIKKPLQYLLKDEHGLFHKNSMVLNAKLKQERVHPLFPKPEEIEKDRTLLYSDHLPIMLEMPVENKETDITQNLKLISWNVLNANSLSGLSQKNEGWETEDQIYERNVRIVEALLRFITSQNPHIFTLQETNPEILDKLLTERLPEGWVFNEGGMGNKILYNSNLIKSNEIPNDATFLGERGIGLGRNRAQDQLFEFNGVVQEVRNVYTLHRDTPQIHEECYRQWLNDGDRTGNRIIVGDTNMRIAPESLATININTGIVPYLFNKFRCGSKNDKPIVDFTDAAFARQQAGGIVQLERKVLNPYPHAAGKEFDVASKDVLRKDNNEQRLFACISDDSRERYKTLLELHDNLNKLYPKENIAVGPTTNVNNERGIGIQCHYKSALFQFIKNHIGEDKDFNFQYIGDGSSTEIQHAVHVMISTRHEEKGLQLLQQIKLAAEKENEIKNSINNEINPEQIKSSSVSEEIKSSGVEEVKPSGPTTEKPLTRIEREKRKMEEEQKVRISKNKEILNESIEQLNQMQVEDLGQILDYNQPIPKYLEYAISVIQKEFNTNHRDSEGNLTGTHLFALYEALKNDNKSIPVLLEKLNLLFKIFKNRNEILNINALRNAAHSFNQAGKDNLKNSLLDQYVYFIKEARVENDEEILKEKMQSARYYFGENEINHSLIRNISSNIANFSNNEEALEKNNERIKVLNNEINKLETLDETYINELIKKFPNFKNLEDKLQMKREEMKIILTKYINGEYYTHEDFGKKVTKSLKKLLTILEDIKIFKNLKITLNTNCRK